jgi:hypothetical protein
LTYVPVEPVFSPDVRGGHHGNNKRRHGHNNGRNVGLREHDDFSFSVCRLQD